VARSERVRSVAAGLHLFDTRNIYISFSYPRALSLSFLKERIRKATSERKFERDISCYGSYSLLRG
jgi:hypothetical protein